MSIAKGPHAFTCRSPRCGCRGARLSKLPRVRARPWFYDWEARIVDALTKRSTTRATLARRLACATIVDATVVTRAMDPVTGVIAARCRRLETPAFTRALDALLAAGRVTSVYDPGAREPRLTIPPLRRLP